MESERNKKIAISLLKGMTYGNVGISEWLYYDELLNSMYWDGKLPDMHEYYILYRDASISGYTAQMDDLHKRIDKIGCKLSVEFHFNSYGDWSVDGNEVLYCSNSGMYYAELLDECLDSLPNRDRGIKKVVMSDNGGGFCCRGKSKAIIIEPFFASHQ